MFNTSKGAAEYQSKTFTDEKLDAENDASESPSPPGETRTEQEIAAAYGINEKSLVRKLYVPNLHSRRFAMTDHQI